MNLDNRNRSPAVPRPNTARLREAAQLLSTVLTFDQPADAVLSRWFRETPEIGQQDRAFLAEAVFGVLRHKVQFDEWQPGATPRQLLLMWLTRAGGFSRRDLSALLHDDEGDWLDGLRRRASTDPSLSAGAGLPQWIIERLSVQHPADFVLALGRALMRPAPLDLRVNTLKQSRDDVLLSLQGDGLSAEATPMSPVGIRLDGKPGINRHPLFTTGVVEVQDEGSQLLGFLLAPRRSDLVVDFCAGAGGKTLMLGAMMQSQGRLYAFDVSEKRLARMKPRLKRSGLSNVHPQVIAHENDSRIKRLAGKIDRVLVDAPCSGLGTLRRNPDLKFRQSPESLESLRIKQSVILASAARLVKPGGRLVYATCSLLDAENGDIVRGFLETHTDFCLVSASEILARYSIAPAVVDLQLQLWPHIHGTDGFFAAVLERRKP
jgi:16S rRNA (cytosine967-C5)-methyltransferase